MTITISATSPLTDVYLAHIANFEPNTGDLAKWSPLTAPSTDSNVKAKIGLFGVELTAFLADCALATTNCKSADYTNYNGWAIGIQWTATADPTANDVNSVTFVGLKEWVGVTWGTTTRSLKDAYFTTTPAAAVPAKADLTLETAVGPFFNWDGELLALSKKEQYAVTFIDSTSTTWTF